MARTNKLTIHWDPSQISTSRINRTKGKNNSGIEFKRIIDVFKNVKTIGAAKKIIKNRNIGNIAQAIYVDNSFQEFKLKTLKNK